MHMPPRYKIVVFDLDGTLIHYGSSWETLHDHFEAMPGNVRANMDAFLAGDIDYKEWMERDIALWHHREPTSSDVDDAFKDHVPCDETRVAIARLKEHGIKVFIVSSGIDVLARRIGEELGVDGAYANALDCDEDGRLTGRGECSVDPLRKHEVVHRIACEEGVSPDEIACVGDTKYDISMFHGVGGRFALKAKHDELREAADASFESITDLVNHILGEC